MKQKKYFCKSKETPSSFHRQLLPSMLPVILFCFVLTSRIHDITSFQITQQQQQQQQQGLQLQRQLQRRGGGYVDFKTALLIYQKKQNRLYTDPVVGFVTNDESLIDGNDANDDDDVTTRILGEDVVNNDNVDTTTHIDPFHNRRRGLLFWLSITTTAFFGGTVANAFPTSPNNNNNVIKNSLSLFGNYNKNKDFYVVDTRDEISSDSVRTEQVDIPVPTLSSEYALLKTLPVKNSVFRTIESNIENVSILRTMQGDIKNSTWVKAKQSVTTAIEILDNKHSQLEPVFNPEDSTELSILKSERGEVLIEEFRQSLIDLSTAIDVNNKTATLWAQKNSLTTLGFLGELLVREYPYFPPSRGKFSYLPRLLGRCQVTLRMKRGSNTILGNITIVADGYTAPITAGAFVDLCIRQYYTGLPVKAVSKRFGPSTASSEQVAVDTNILGSFNEGFYDPLTAKLRRIPLEIIRTGPQKPKLSYASGGLPDTSLSDMLAVSGSSTGGFVAQSNPLLTFDTPGLIALNHPKNDRNGGSAEFFGLTDNTLPEGVKKSLLDGEYAPFGFIVIGYPIFCQLQPGDVIDAVFVDEFGKNNLVKIRQSSFKEAAKGTEAASLE